MFDRPVDWPGSSAVDMWLALLRVPERFCPESAGRCVRESGGLMLGYKPFIRHRHTRTSADKIQNFNILLGFITTAYKDQYYKTKRLISAFVSVKFIKSPR